MPLPSGLMEKLISASEFLVAKVFQSSHSPVPSLTSGFRQFDWLVLDDPPPPVEVAITSYSLLWADVPFTTKHCRSPESLTWICSCTTKLNVSLAESADPSSLAAEAETATEYEPAAGAVPVRETFPSETEAFKPSTSAPS